MQALIINWFINNRMIFAWFSYFFFSTSFSKYTYTISFLNQVTVPLIFFFFILMQQKIKYILLQYN